MKDELADARKEDSDKQKQKMDQQEANNKVVEPLEEANEDVNRLLLQKKKHDKIMDKLTRTAQGIAQYDSTSKEIEWQYEVRLQQF